MKLLVTKITTMMEVSFLVWEHIEKLWSKVFSLENYLNMCGLEEPNCSNMVGVH